MQSVSLQVLYAANQYAEQVCWALIVGSLWFVVFMHKKSVMGVFWSSALVMPIALSAFLFWFPWNNMALMSGMVMRNKEVVGMIVTCISHAAHIAIINSITRS